jgi:hypothetical protein
MHWIIDLLIDKLKKENTNNEEHRVPLHIDVYEEPNTTNKDKEDKEEKRVIIIDI